MFRWLLAIFLGVLALVLGARAADESLARYDRVVVEPAKISIYVGSVTMTFSPATRKGGAYEADYAAKVFPFFFMGEKGKLVLDAPDDALRRLARGETVEFTGRGVSANGKERRFEGRVSPADVTSGKLKVRVIVSKRIELIFNTTYRFEPVEKQK